MLQVPAITASNTSNDNIILQGLSTLPNQLSQVPSTPSIGLVVADDIVIDKDGTLTTRRGVKRWSDISFSEYYSIIGATAFDGEIFFVGNTSTNSYIYGTYNLQNGTFINHSGFHLPQMYFASYPYSMDILRFIKNNNNLYYLTDQGTYKLESGSNSSLLAGAPPGLDGIATLDSGTSGGFLNTNSTVAYRVEWQYTDENNNLIVGAPSNRFLVANTSYGYQEINYGGTITGGSASTGLSNSTTAYTCSIAVDGGTPAAVSIEGQNAQTFSALINQIETQVTGVNVTIQSGNLIITSNDNNINSAISVVDGSTNPLFHSTTGFVSILTAVPSTKNVDITFYIPAEIRMGSSGPFGNVSWQYVVYRGNQSAGATIQGDDECQQVYTGTPTNTDLTNGYISFTDSLSDSYRGTTIDTAPSQYGAGGGNYRPPGAVDVEVYRNYTFYANTRSQATLDITLVDVGSPSGLQVGDTITFSNINGDYTITLTGGSSENISTNTFLVETAFDPATNIEKTAQSIIKVLNLCSGNNVIADWGFQLNAFYTSAFGGLPGAMNFTTRTNVSFNTTANKPNASSFYFYVNSSRGGAFSPNLPSSGVPVVGASNRATADIKQNRLYISKYLQPESVPIGLSGYEIDVGSPSNPILGIKATRDVLFIFKGGAEEGIYYIQGTSPSNFQLLPFDQTVHMLAPNTMQLLNNAIYFFSDQGIVSVSDSGGVQIESRPIEYELLNLSSSNYSNFIATAWAMTYQSDRKYILGVQTDPSDPYTTQIFVKNYFTNQWTRWTRKFNGGFVSEIDDKAFYYIPSIYATNPANGDMLVVERKAFDDSDYSDESYTINITSVNSQIITVDSASLPYVQVGYGITQGYNQGTVISIDASNNITINPQTSTTTWTTGNATSVIPIEPYFVTHPIHCGTPNVVKNFNEISFDLGPSTFTKCTVGFLSDMNIGTTSKSTIITLPAQSLGGTYGNFYYGSGIYGGGSSIVLNSRIRSWVPQPYRKANWIQPIFSLSETSGAINLQGIGLVYTPLSPNQK